MNAKYSLPRSVFGSLAAVGLFVSVTACKDDFDYRNNVGQPIAFTLSAPDAWHDGMSVNENAPTTRCTSVKALSGGETKLYLHTVVADNPAEEKGAVTRGTPVRTFEKFKEKYPTFSLSGICYTGEYPTDESQNKWTANFAHNILCNTNEETSENSLLWPSNGNVRFFAFAPTTEDFSKLETGGSLTLSEATYEGSPTLTYTVPADVTMQIDLMTACANLPDATTSNVDLKFGHALTAVQIKCGKDMLAGTITEVSISGIYGSGTHVIGSQTWDTSHASTATYTIKKDIKLPFKEGSEDKYHAAEDTPITGTETDNLTFMLIPQELPEDATITITFTDSATGMKRSLSGSIGGKTWEAGKIVTYTLSQSSIHITPKIEFSKKDGAVMPYSGVWYDVDYKPAKVEIVQAGVDTKQIAEIPINQIKFKYRLDGSEDWVDCTTNADGLLQIAPQPAYETMRTNFATTEVGSESSPEPLTVEGETANCYLVDKAGYYSLPLVYGNGVSGMLTTATRTNGMTYFPMHDDSQMPADAKISGAHDAVLCWQDAPDLIDPASVGLNEGKTELLFRIRRPTLTQGNALLAVRNSSKEILWSWHIWVTPYKSEFYDQTVRLGTTDYYLALYNLGWCDSHGQNDSREFSLKAEIDMSAYGGTTQSVEIPGKFMQEEYIGSDAGDNTYYQWGRKDPMLGGIYNSNTTRYTYNNKGNESSWDKYEFTMENKQVFNQYNDEAGCNYSFCKNPGDKIDISDIASDGATVGYTIKHPYMFITNSRTSDKSGETSDYNYRNHWHKKAGNAACASYLPDNTIAFNLWDAGATIENNGTGNVTKSVYDPCPPKFKMPPREALNWIVNNKSSFTLSGNSYVYGNIKFPLTGVRNYALRNNEYQTVHLAGSTDNTFDWESFYKISMPAFKCLTFISCATIFHRGVQEGHQLYILRVENDRNYSESEDRGNTNYRIIDILGSSNGYGVAVRPILSSAP